MSGAPIRLHWFPVNPSWIVSAGIIILAVLPHKIPVFWRSLMMHTTTRLLFAAATVYIWFLSPVLGTALMIMLVSVAILPVSEQFVIANLNKDKVQPRRTHWLVEDTLAEEPESIQEKTNETNLNFDKVSDDSKTTWHAEKLLGEHPEGIQDKPVSEWNEMWN